MAILSHLSDFTSSPLPEMVSTLGSQLIWSFFKQAFACAGPSAWRPPLQAATWLTPSLPLVSAEMSPSICEGFTLHPFNKSSSWLFLALLILLVWTVFLIHSQKHTHNFFIHCFSQLEVSSKRQVVIFVCSLLYLQHLQSCLVQSKNSHIH